jgi:hypothetical protein
VLHRVGQRLGRHVVRRDLDRLGAPRVHRDVKVDRYRRPAGERPQRRAKTALGQDRRVDPARELLQLRHRVGQSRRDARQLSSQVIPVGGNIGLRGARRQSERDQPLLGTVVQVALDPAAGLVRRGDDPPARGGQLRPALRIRDRGREQLGELLQAALRIDRQQLVCGRDDHRAPQTALDNDRARDRRDDTQATCGCRDGPAGRRPVHRVDSGGPSGAVDLRRRHSRLELPSHPDREVEGLRDADKDDPQALVLEPEDSRLRPEEESDLVADGREDLDGRPPASPPGTPCATSVATRRNAACSSASRAREARLSVFAIAVATSSVKEASRASVSGGSCWSRV